jgi:PIN domain nuclease of toxin-antitoxin system
MKLLLDTHAFIWWDSRDNRLSAAAREACLSPTNTVHLSLASVWEMRIKVQLGKLVLREALSTVIRDQQRNGLSLLSVTLEDVLALDSLPFHHRDPFDRLLISQAQRGNLVLVTHDTKIGHYDVPILW